MSVLVKSHGFPYVAMIIWIIMVHYPVVGNELGGRAYRLPCSISKLEHGYLELGVFSIHPFEWSCLPILCLFEK